jgi:hypothetical protein
VPSRRRIPSRSICSRDANDEKWLLAQSTVRLGLISILNRTFGLRPQPAHLRHCRLMPLCAFPAQARYNGAPIDIDAEANRPAPLAA